MTFKLLNPMASFLASTTPLHICKSPNFARLFGWNFPLFYCINKQTNKQITVTNSESFPFRIYPCPNHQKKSCWSQLQKEPEFGQTFPIWFWVKTKVCSMAYKALCDVTPLTSSPLLPTLLTLLHSHWSLCCPLRTLGILCPESFYICAWNALLQVLASLIPLAPSWFNSNVTLVWHSLITLFKMASIPTPHLPEFPVPSCHFIFLHCIYY